MYIVQLYGNLSMYNCNVFNPVQVINEIQTITIRYAFLRY